MKNTLIILGLLFITSCSIPSPIYLGMGERQFIVENIDSKDEIAEMNTNRTVYRVPYQVDATQTGYKFYYFKDGKLTAMDEGFYPRGAKMPVPTPL